MNTVAVTGASKGIGKALALYFVNAGYEVIGIYHTDDKAMEELKIHDIKLIKLDVSDHDVVQEELGKRNIDVLINNAGVYLDNMVWKMPEEKWDKVLDVNMKGVFNCTKAVLPYMRERYWGRIINITSVVGQVGAIGCSNYAASKAGVIGFTKAVAREVANKGITVNALSLGYINIGMNLRLPDSMRSEILKSIPVGRWGEVSEVVSAVCYLASWDAGYITGQVLNLNGGCNMNG